MPDVYRCICCQLDGRSGVCPCVFAACPRCWRCLKCCRCPERFARECAAADGLDDLKGPFYDLLAADQNC